MDGAIYYVCSAARYKVGERAGYSKNYNSSVCGIVKTLLIFLSPLHLK